MNITCLPIFFSLTPVDSKEGEGLTLDVTIRLCPCLADHGVCGETLLAENYTITDLYQLQTCSCFAAWTGMTKMSLCNFNCSSG